MKRLLALALPLLALVGCEIHSSNCHYDSDGSYHCGYHHNVIATTSYYDEGTTNIILVEEEDPYPTCTWEQPFYHDAEWCSFDGITCCGWSQVTSSVEHVYCYFDYCGWDLVEINKYY